MNRNRGNKKQRALVVEPDRQRADQLIGSLEEAGFIANVVRNPREALMALAKPPKIILIDATGPLDPNVEFLRGLQRITAMRSVPVVGVHDSPPPSGYDLGQLRKHGVSTFVLRPVRSAALRAAVTGRVSAGPPPPMPDAPTQPPRVASGPSMSMTLPPRRQPPPAPPVPVSNDQITAVGVKGVSAALDFAGMVAEAAVTSASTKELILRTKGPFPPKGQPVRVAIRFRDAVDGSMRDVPVRIIGAVTDIETSGVSRRVRVEVRVATPGGNLELLERYLARNRGA